MNLKKMARVGTACVAVVLLLSACAGNPNIVEGAANAPATVSTTEPTTTSTSEPTTPAVPETVTVTPSPTSVEETPVEVTEEVAETTNPEMMVRPPGYSYDGLFEYSDNGAISTKYQYIAEANQLEYVLIPAPFWKDQGVWAVAPFGNSCFFTIWSPPGEPPSVTTFTLFARHDNTENTIVDKSGLYTEYQLLLILGQYQSDCAKTPPADMV